LSLLVAVVLAQKTVALVVLVVCVAPLPARVVQAV
jgi:hypothetical protein